MQCLSDPTRWSAILETAAACANVPIDRAPVYLWYGLVTALAALAVGSLVVAVAYWRRGG